MKKEKIGRNAPCPCGSGKKYKHCHYEIDRENKKDIEFFPEKDQISPTHKRLIGLPDGRTEKKI